MFRRSCKPFASGTRVRALRLDKCLRPGSPRDCTNALRSVSPTSAQPLARMLPRVIGPIDFETGAVPLAPSLEQVCDCLRFDIIFQPREVIRCAKFY